MTSISIFVKPNMQVVWVTGASTGIGAALAMEAVKHGAKVAITARSPSRSKCFSNVQNEIFQER